MISEKIKKKLLQFLKAERKPELVTAYLFALSAQKEMRPVLFVPGKTIYQSKEQALSLLEKEGKVWRETEIRIGYGPPTINEKTKKIYICPFTGKVFGDNTHPNPQDAIYDWVSKCSENKERSGGVPVKRFFVSDDPDVIKEYIEPPKKEIKKTVFSSVTDGKLYHAKDKVIESFSKNYFREISLVEVQNQNRYELHSELLSLLQEYLTEEKIAEFVENLAQDESFLPYVKTWIESEE